MANLIYIADPMCSWCYGFGPELVALQQRFPEVPLTVVVGGLRAYQTEALTAEKKNMILSHWEHVHAASGLPFSDAALSSAGFVYDTEPACRAVVAARQLAASTSLPVFHAIQQAFYAEGRDVTKAEILAPIAAAAMTQAGFAIDAPAFQTTWSSQAAVTATRNDFVQTQQWGVTGFPTLVVERDGKFDLLTAGFSKAPALTEKLQALIKDDRGLINHA
jgi:putative protein-disulfide isomerase